MSEFLSLVDELVNLNTLVPVRHLGFASTVGSGIVNVPLIAPLASATILPPNVPPSGVTYVDTSILSKNGYNLVFGLNLVPLNVIVLLLTNGTNATLIILSPNDSLTTCGTIVLLTPVLV